MSAVRDFEVGTSAPASKNLEAMAAALEAAGVEFIPENGGGAGVRHKKRTVAAEDHPKPVGPATDAVEAMDAAIKRDRASRRDR